MTASPPPPAIVETYSLINNVGTSPRLSAFVVRLTDASLKALNHAVAEARQRKSKGDFSSGFVDITNSNNNSDGVLCFGGSSTSNNVHKFSLADAQRDLGPKGQLEALVQTRDTSSSSSGRMRCLGPVTQRLQISATTEDTFESTKQKAQLANEEMRKNAAKVLKGPTGGAVTKVLQKINRTHKAVQRPLTPVGHSQQQRASPSSTASKNGTNLMGDIVKRPLRQRILYRLILAPMTSVDLLQKLTHEGGLNETDRGNFERILHEVAQTRSGGEQQMFEVKRTCYNEIRPDDWPHYTSWERNSCRRALLTAKLPSNLAQQLNSNSNSNGSNKAHTSSNNDVVADGTQRVSGKIGYRPPPKRPVQQQQAQNQLSPQKSPSPGGASSSSTSPTTLTNFTSSPPRKKMALDNKNLESSIDVTPTVNGSHNLNNNNANFDDFEDDQASEQFNRKRRQQHQKILAPSNFHSSISHTAAMTKDDERQQQKNVNDLRHDYPSIHTPSERRRYKDEFDKHYPNYMKLYEKLRKVACEFETLGEKLKRSPKGTEAYRDVEQEILMKYRKFESDAEMHRMRTDHERLRQKLGVIKERVKEYDDRRPICAVAPTVNNR